MENPQNTGKTEFERLISESGINKKKFHESTGMTDKTWNKRSKEPWSFTAKEISIIAKVLRMSPAEVLQIILSDLQ